MRQLGLGMVVVLMLCGTASATDPERLCGDFEVFKSPDAVRYVGQFERNKRPYTIVITEQLEDGRALVFYAYGKRPNRGDDREGCTIRIARFKEEGLLFMRFSRTTALTVNVSRKCPICVNRKCPTSVVGVGVGLTPSGWFRSWGRGWTEGA